MAKQVFTNNAVTELAADFATGVLVFTVTTGEGALFPNPTAGDWFLVTLSQNGVREIVQVTARATDSFTCVRAQEGTSDLNWLTAASVSLNTTAGFLGTLSGFIEDNPVLGPVSSIDDNIATFDLTTGKLIQDGGQTIAQVIAAGAAAAPQGDVVGPAVAVDSRVAMFDGTTGKLLKDSGLTLAGSNTGDQTISDATITTTDITTNDFSTSKHGFVPKGPNVGQFLKDDGTWGDPEPSGALPEAILNGHMQLWQRGVTFTGVATGLVTADQWQHDYAGSLVMDVTQQALGDATIQTATGQRIQFAYRTTVTTADASIAAGDFHVLSQAIEGYRALPYLHNQFTVSFYVRSSVTGTYCFSIRNAGGPPDRTFLKTFTVDVADTWERKTIVVPTQDATGTWNYTTGTGMRMGISLMSGTTFEGTDDTWNTGNLLNVSGGSNFFSATSRTFDITAMQLDLGPRAKAYRGLPFAEDLQLCERYFQKSYDVNVAPGAVSALGQVVFRANGTTPLHHVALRTPMRVAPTVTEYNPTDGTAGQWEDVGGAAGASTTDANIGMNGFEIGLTVAGDNNEVNGHWTAEAKL